MPVSTLDPRSALIVVDLQKGIVGHPLAHPIEGILANAAALAAAFRSRELPVVLVTVDGGAAGRTERGRGVGGTRSADWAEVVPELHQQPSDLAVVKRTWGAFLLTDLAERLRAQGVTQVVVLGVSTSSGVESTAREAYGHGFNVTLAVDAMTDREVAVHDSSVANIFPKLGETGTTAEILALLEA